MNERFFGFNVRTTLLPLLYSPLSANFPTAKQAFTLLFFLRDDCIATTIPGHFFTALFPNATSLRVDTNLGRNNSHVRHKVAPDAAAASSVIPETCPPRGGAGCNVELQRQFYNLQRPRVRARCRENNIIVNNDLSHNYNNLILSITPLRTIRPLAAHGRWKFVEHIKRVLHRFGGRSEVTLECGVEWIHFMVQAEHNGE